MPTLGMQDWGTRRFSRWRFNTAHLLQGVRVHSTFSYLRCTGDPWPSSLTVQLDCCLRYSLPQTQRKHLNSRTVSIILGRYLNTHTHSYILILALLLKLKTRENLHISMVAQEFQLHFSLFFD